MTDAGDGNEPHLISDVHLAGLRKPSLGKFPVGGANNKRNFRFWLNAAATRTHAAILYVVGGCVDRIGTE